jgi:HSP20 family protein
VLIKKEKELLNMAGLIPFNRKDSGLARTGLGTGFEDFYNMLDDFFSDGWMSGRNLLRDTFKIDVRETEGEYQVEAELPGVKRDEIDLRIDDDSLSILVNRGENLEQEGKTYIHKERRASSMNRRVRLANAKLDEIKAKLEDGVLVITVPKQDKSNASRKIAIE